MTSIQSASFSSRADFSSKTISRPHDKVTTQYVSSLTSNPDIAQELEIMRSDIRALQESATLVANVPIQIKQIKQDISNMYVILQFPEKARYEHNQAMQGVLEELHSMFVKRKNIILESLAKDHCYTKLFPEFAMPVLSTVTVSGTKKNEALSLSYEDVIITDNQRSSSVSHDYLEEATHILLPWQSVPVERRHIS